MAPEDVGSVEEDRADDAAADDDNNGTRFILSFFGWLACRLDERVYLS